jgi:hypothetical protein
MGTHRGFSIGISDVTPSDRLTEMKHEILLEGYKKVGAFASMFVIITQHI